MIYSIFRELLYIVFKLLGYVPTSLIVITLTPVLRLGYRFNVRMRNTALRNLEIAFPKSDTAWKWKVLRDNAREMAQLIADSILLTRITKNWIEQNIDMQEAKKVFEQYQNKPLLILASHFGSFELIPAILGLNGITLHAVARPFRPALFNDVLTRIRQRQGSIIFPRQGGLKRMRRLISEKKCVGMLFDQNVTKANAVFVDWFGLPAATAKSPAYLALHDECVPLLTNVYRVNKRLVMHVKEIDITSIRNNSTLSKNDRIQLVTEHFVTALEEEIRNRPALWFWVHRRWKTRPHNEPETIYTTSINSSLKQIKEEKINE
jgi:Kdo2-lipid IVA lauroyltransferase/acyltransferase